MTDAVSVPAVEVSCVLVFCERRCSAPARDESDLIDLFSSLPRLIATTSTMLHKIPGVAVVSYNIAFCFICMPDPVVVYLRRASIIKTRLLELCILSILGHARPFLSE
jgi:hypothetical protein